jgi:hypothetical protein
LTLRVQLNQQPAQNPQASGLCRFAPGPESSRYKSNDFNGFHTNRFAF